MDATLDKVNSSLEQDSDVVEDVKMDEVDAAQIVEGELAERRGFTSEIFKIELNGIPKFFGANQAKKLLHRLDLKPHKIKQCGPGAHYMFINFGNEEDREKAIAVLDGFSFKGKKLRAFKSKPSKDPLAKIREEKEPELDPNVPAEDLIKSAVCQLSHLPYEEQLKVKMDEIEKIMASLRKEFLHQNAFLVKHGLTSDDLAKIDPFVRSPVVDGYRNKCEFSFGNHPFTGEVTVGFRLASYRKGSLAVVGVENVPNVSEKMKKIVKKFETFAREIGYAPFSHTSHQGYWKQLTVRTSRTGEILLWAILHPQNLSKEEKDDLEKKMIDTFVANVDDASIKVTSLHVQFLGQRLKGEPEPVVKCISGTPTIIETLMKERLEFSISPQAFFQINTEGAEKVYEVVGEIAGLDKETVLLDVCCGTGTIGLCLAAKCKQVLGVDIVSQAICDAEVNAKRNEIENTTFYSGRAEYMLPNMLKKHQSNVEQVAVVDPPRAGLHNKAIHALRSSSVQRLVYISCDAKNAMQNFINLGQLPSNLYQGDPFIPKRVIPVDLFPHTPHFELVIYFERFPIMKLAAEQHQQQPIQ